MQREGICRCVVERGCCGALSAKPARPAYFPHPWLGERAQQSGKLLIRHGPKSRATEVMENRGRGRVRCDNGCCKPAGAAVSDKEGYRAWPGRIYRLAA